MKKLLLSLLLSLLAFTAQAQMVDEVLANHLEAMGGAAWDNVSTLRLEAQVSIQMAPVMVIPMTITAIHHQAARVDVVVMGETQTNCIHGSTGWSINSFGDPTEVTPLSAEEVQDMKPTTDLSGPLFNYNIKGYALEYLGQEELDGTPVHKIKVFTSADKTEYAYIDPVSWYQIKKVTVTTEDGQSFTSESFYSDFKRVGDLVFPFTIKQHTPLLGATVTTVTDIKINEPVDKKMFEMPGK